MHLENLTNQIIDFNSFGKHPGKVDFSTKKTKERTLCLAKTQQYFNHFPQLQRGKKVNLEFSKLILNNISLKYLKETTINNNFIYVLEIFYLLNKFTIYLVNFIFIC